MSERLGAGDRFPTLGLACSDGQNRSIPEDLGSDFSVVLFYRGHW